MHETQQALSSSSMMKSEKMEVSKPLAIQEHSTELLRATAWRWLGTESFRAMGTATCKDMMVNCQHMMERYKPRPSSLRVFKSL